MSDQNTTNISDISNATRNSTIFFEWSYESFFPLDFEDEIMAEYTTNTSDIFNASRICSVFQQVFLTFQLSVTLKAESLWSLLWITSTEPLCLLSVFNFHLYAIMTWFCFNERDSSVCNIYARFAFLTDRRDILRSFDRRPIPCDLIADWDAEMNFYSSRTASRIQGDILSFSDFLPLSALASLFRAPNVTYMAEKSLDFLSELHARSHYRKPSHFSLISRKNSEKNDWKLIRKKTQ